MAEFQDKAGLQGLATRTELDRYCYYVAGVVGETLTEFFIDFEPQLSTQRETLKHLARSFGTGLQLTNILKDRGRIVPGEFVGCRRIYWPNIICSLAFAGRSP